MIGKTISHYKILEKLGGGGMGVVYKAEDTKLKRTVALKFLPADLAREEEAKDRFVHEAQAASSLDHPNICTIHEIDETVDGQIFIAMAYYEGETLKKKIERGPIPLEETIDIGIQIAQGLAKAHEEDIIHRDIKPANVMITDRGNVKIVDFGLAKLSGRTQLTKEGTTMGTVAYMSPEQTQGIEVDQPTDIWALGAVIYEMITGQQPFAGDYEQAVMYSIMNEDPEPLTALRTGLPMELERIVNKCLAKEPDNRYQHADELIVDLRQCGRSTSKVPTSRVVSVRSKISWLIGVTLAVFLLLLLIYFTDVFRSGAQNEAERIMLAVLPFENLGDPEDEYFSDGMTEEITSRLGVVRGLGIISRTSAMQYKKTKKSIKQIGEELGVDYVLEGSVRWSRAETDESLVRVTAQLIRVADDTHIWAEQYDEAVDEIFTIQSTIADLVSKALDLVLLESELKAIARKSTDNLEAYEYYLRARDQDEKSFASGDVRGRDQAVQMYEKAIQLDPNFAMAYIFISNTHSLFYHFGWDRSEERLAKSKAAIDEALRLQPDLPEAHLILGYYYYRGFRDYDLALEMFEIARQGRPNISQTLLSDVKRRQGKWEESIAARKETFRLNPRNHRYAWQVGINYFCMRRYQEADAWFTRSLALNQNFRRARAYKTWNYILWKGQTQEAKQTLATIRQDAASDEIWRFIHRVERNYKAILTQLDSLSYDSFGGRNYFQKNLAYAGVYYLMNKPSLMHAHADTARIVLEKVVKESPRVADRHVALGLAYAYLGLKDQAIQSGQRSLEIRPVSKDALDAPIDVLLLAEIFTVVGEYEAAIDQLKYLMSIPALVSIPILRVDPIWDPLRGQPRFQRLLNEGEISKK